jgi:hypothetical protein
MSGTQSGSVNRLGWVERTPWQLRSLFGGRCEEKQVEDVRVCHLGNFWQGTRNRFQNSDFSRISRNVQVSKFGFISGFPQFLGDPKKFLKHYFSVVSWDFEGWACPKILCSFPATNRFPNLNFLQFPAIFRGTQKFSKRGFFTVSWDFEGRACPKKFRTQTSLQFSQDFEGTDPPKILVNPQFYPRFFLGF